MWGVWGVTDFATNLVWSFYYRLQNARNELEQNKNKYIDSPSITCAKMTIHHRLHHAFGMNAPDDKPTLSDVFANSAVDPAVTGFVLAKLRHKTRPVLCIQDHVSTREAGRFYIPGLKYSWPLLQVDVSHARDVLFAMEEGLRCRDVSAVIGEVWGDPKVLDFTASKRLMMRAEASGIPCWLIRRGAPSTSLSAARDRWRISSLPSEQNPHDPGAPGNPRWQVELFRSRRSKPGIWVASYDSTADRLDFSAPFRDGAVAENHGALRQRAN